MPNEVPPRIKHLEREADSRREAAHAASPALVEYVDIKHDIQKARTEWFAHVNRKLIERYGKYTTGLLAGLAVTLLALGVVTAILFGSQSKLGHKQIQEALERNKANRRLAQQSHELAVQNCANLARLAGLTSEYIGRQESQSRRFFESGATLGIPEALLPKLIAESKRSQAKYVGDLKGLADQNCAPPPKRAPLPPAHGVTGTTGPASALPRVVPAHGAVHRVGPRASIGRPPVRSNTAPITTTSPSSIQATPTATATSSTPIPPVPTVPNSSSREELPLTMPTIPISPSPKPCVPVLSVCP